MTRIMTAFGILAVLALWITPVPGMDSQAVAADDEAMKLAVKLTDEGAATFSTLNASAMAAYYTDDAEIALMLKSNEGLKLQKYNGKAEIEKAYADMFKNPETIKSKNTVEYAKFLSPEVLVIAGTFLPNTLKADSPKIPFYQVRVKQGDKWLTSNLRIFFLPD